MYECKILKDSINAKGCRLTTLEVTFPRIVLAEFNAHRMLSRNSASSRAIPVEKMLKRVRENPFIPERWPINRPGMQATEYLPDDTSDDLAWTSKDARFVWLEARDLAASQAERLLTLGVHKQIANRLLEPFLWHTVIVTATEWENFFALRTHKDAQPEIQRIAHLMRDAMDDSDPLVLVEGEWHLPLIFAEDIAEVESWTDDLTMRRTFLARISSARCARVSYLTHDGKRDLIEDRTLADKLQSSGHMSPFEHAAEALDGAVMFGNFKGWRQYRKTLLGEAVFGSLSGGHRG